MLASREKSSLLPNNGFTLVELLIVISIIALLASVILPALNDALEVTRVAKAKKELRSIHQSLVLYKNEYGDYPADTNRSIPPGLEEFLAPGVWPSGAWRDSVLDWDNWDDPDDPSERILQISIRFCPIGHPEDCHFPVSAWADDFDINSAVYYCVEGACRSHISKPVDHPGYCVNCQ